MFFNAVLGTPMGLPHIVSPSLSPAFLHLNKVHQVRLLADTKCFTNILYQHIFMDPVEFQHALQDPMPSGDSLDALIEDWNFHLSEAIDEIAPQCPLCFLLKLTPWLCKWNSGG